MKKLFLTCLMLASTVSLFTAGVHIPAAGPVQLGDNIIGGAQAGVARGAIMKAILDNNPANLNSNPILAAANAAVANFDGYGQNFRSYQAIVTNISQSTNNYAAIDAIKAFENVIMYLYDYDIYVLGGYKPGTSIFVTGVRWSWLNPLTYFSPKSYFSDNDARAQQLIDELEKLADAVKIHSVVEYARINTTVHSYRHWRKNLMLTMVAYLVLDRYKHGPENSIINQFYQAGLENSGQIAINHLMNLGSGLQFAGQGIMSGARGIGYVVGRGADFMLHGKKAFQNNDEKVKEIKSPVDKVRSKAKDLVQGLKPQAWKSSTVSVPVSVATKSWTDYWKSYCNTFPKSKLVDDSLNS